MPYLCRLPRGWASTAQYIPDDGILPFGIVWFTAFALIPGGVTFLAADALAAISLVFIPIYVAIAVFAVELVRLAVPECMHRRKQTAE